MDVLRNSPPGPRPAPEWNKGCTGKPPNLTQRLATHSRRLYAKIRSFSARIAWHSASAALPRRRASFNFKWRSPRAYVAWPRFTLAGIIIKLSTKRLTHQSGFLKQCGIDLPCARKPLPFVGIDLPIPRWKGCLLTFNQLI